MKISFKKLGPGLLFAGAAIGVSHLVQSTRAGADFGYGLIWALLLVHIFKYPFFQFAPRYALATGESLLDGYKKMGKPVLLIYFLLTFTTMFTIQTTVTIVTAGIASMLFGSFLSPEIWAVIILSICALILIKGKYSLLDQIMKIIVITLTISTIIAVVLAANTSPQPLSFIQKLPENTLEISFLIAFMGWMPAPLDISIWQSLWALEKRKTNKSYDLKSSLFDFNVGYLATIIIGLGFMALGALVMFQSGTTFSDKASVFSNQLISMYTKSLGNWSYLVIGIAAFTTMFSTTLTTLDASPRTMAKTTELLFGHFSKRNYLLWICVLIVGTVSIFFFLGSEMGFLIKVATIISFLTAPFYAIINYKLISSKHTPVEWRPSLKMHVLSWLGILFLIGFSIWYLTTL
ncbi:Nramp family divalent metal transporter [Gelidibacter maritimus]|uniref:Nramp family divalent metal transporter n=1 Tax=Gelidibacter maritimus TaxID=2761487 RepID=A0A7W2M5Z5_9FLAO|nr:Nramp family divalent metal transporter [Gelidibacter maritimus]MBA6153303.1 Nramp family divalent metal transporter [Gelidibacter maritimus]